MILGFKRKFFQIKLDSNDFQWYICIWTLESATLKYIFYLED